MKPLRLKKETLMRLDEESSLTEGVVGGITPTWGATDVPECYISITATNTTKGGNVICHVITAGG